MTELEQNRIFDISYEMRGLAATLVAASRGDIQDPERVVEFAAGKVDRLAGNLADCITDNDAKETAQG